jgi:hypothetical protein
MKINDKINLIPEKQIVLGKPFYKICFQPIKNRLHHKPTGGIWSSTYTPKEKYVSSWEKFLIEDGWDKKEYAIGYTFNYKKDIKCFTIDSCKDLEKFVEIVGFQKISDEVKKLDPFLKNFLLDKASNKFNFEKAAELFDIIHLTYKGYLETRKGLPSKLNLWGYDCECCLTMNLNAIDLNTIKKYKKKYLF